MAVHKLLQNTFSMPAAADLSAAQYRLVADGTAGVNYGTDNTAVIIGVLINKPNAANRAARIAGPGSIVKCEAGASIAPGVQVIAGAGGRAVVQTSGTGVYSAGISVDVNTAASGEFFSLLVQPIQYTKA